LSRLKAALQRPALGYAGVSVNVSQGGNNDATSTLGPNAVYHPPLDNPQQLMLSTIPDVWGHRRDVWHLHGGFAGAFAGYPTYPVARPHYGATLNCDGVCGLHFIFDGQAFEVLFSGGGLWVTLVVDGQYMAPGVIRQALSGGVAGAPLSTQDCLTRIDFGSRATRHVSLYGRSSRGPCAIVTAPGDTLQPWDRSGEPSMTAMADSYGGAAGPNWLSGPFWEAAAQLGIPHLDIDAEGGTGYARNAANADTMNLGNTFRARIPTDTDIAPDLVITAGGINDNNAIPMSGLYATPADALAGFNAGVTGYYNDLRAALPQAVLVSLGPWAPNITRPTYFMARPMADTIKAALQAVGGPWVFLDNLNGGWVNSAGVSASPTGAWQTGTGNTAHPAGDGNGDIYLEFDGVHPNVAGCLYLGTRIADGIRAALLAL
jgi:lysophospholipase L1-like esterase